MSPKNRRNCRGIALVELAIVIPLILLFVFGTWDVTRLVLVHLDLSRALHEGLRYSQASKSFPYEGREDKSSLTINCGTSPEHCVIQQRIATLANTARPSGSVVSFSIVEIVTSYDIRLDEGPTPTAEPTQIPCDSVVRGASGSIHFTFEGAILPFFKATTWTVRGRVPYAYTVPTENTGC